jgi:thiol-disulfide isomerase/thioredoxin
MNYFKFILILLISCCSINSFSQKSVKESNGYTVTIATKNLQKERIILFMKYGTNNQMIISDSLTIKSNIENVVFKKPKKLIGVIYFLKLESQKEELMLAIDNNSTINLSLESKAIKSIICTKNNINIDFINYQLTDYKQNKDSKIEKINALTSKYPNSILNLYFKIEKKILEKKSEKLEEQISYRNNFFKTIDKNDKRIFLVPNIYRLLYNFILSTPINNDYYIQNIDLLLKGMDCNSKNYSVYLKWFISNLNYFEIKNLEDTYVYLYTNYLKNDKCKIFSDTEIASNDYKYNTILKVPLNSKIPEIELVDKDLTTYSLSKIYPEFDFTFIAFFSPSCHHCQKTMPIVNASFENLKKKYPNKKIQLISILNDSDESEWEQFVSETKISSWLNLKSNDPDKKYRAEFNAYSNPNFFLVDKKGSVVLKSNNPAAIEELILKN